MNGYEMKFNYFATIFFVSYDSLEVEDGKNRLKSGTQ